MMRWLKRLLHAAAPPLVTFCGLIVVWDLAVRFGRVRPYLLPPPGKVFAAMTEHWQRLAEATLLTAAGASCGFVLSLVVGTLIAFAFAQSAMVRRGFYPYAILLQTVPIVAVAPLIIHWFGYGFQSVVVVAFMLGVFPIITNVTTGLTRLDPNLVDLFAVYNAGWHQVLLKLRVPGAVPYLVSGAKISCGLSVIGAIVGEMFAGSSAQRFGLGYLIFSTNEQLKTDYALAAVFCSTLLGMAVFGFVNLIGATVLWRWHDAPLDR